MKYYKKIFLLLLFQSISIYFLFSQNIDKGELAVIISEYDEFCNINEKKSWGNLEILFKLFYEGSNIPPADMLFFSNSIMVLRSRFYSPNFEAVEYRFFKFTLNNSELELIAIDKRTNINNWLDVAQYHMDNNRARIISIDRINNSVIYNFEKKEIYFSGFLFYLVN